MEHKRKLYSWLLLLCLCLSPVACGDWMFKKDDSTPPPTPDFVTPVVKPEFRCLIIEETKNRSLLPSSQLAILTGDYVDNYMKEHCVKNEKTGKPEFRIYDVDLKLNGPWLTAVQNNPPKKDPVTGKLVLPWFYCTNGTTGTNGPLPKTKDAPKDFITIIKHFAEPK